jgi:hypothetical protein
LTGREQFGRAAAGDGVAFVPYVWEELPQFVRQPVEGWRDDPTTARRLLQDAASLAAADGMVIGAGPDVVRRAAAAGETGPDALDDLARTEAARRGYELVEVLVASVPFAVVAALPDLATLEREHGGDDPEATEIAEDALTDFARGFLEAGADALAVIGDDPESVRATARRVHGVASYYGRPVVVACVSPGEPGGWVEGEDGVTVAVVGDDSPPPDLASGILLTDGDVSTRWDADRLHALGRRTA